MDALIAPNHNSRAYFGLNQLVEGPRSRARYIEIVNGNHFDAFIETLFKMQTLLSSACTASSTRRLKKCWTISSGARAIWTTCQRARFSRPKNHLAQSGDSGGGEQDQLRESRGCHCWWNAARLSIAQKKLGHVVIRTASASSARWFGRYVPGERVGKPDDDTS
jgi:hypothetical protein